MPQLAERCFNYIVADYRNASNQVIWLKNHTWSGFSGPDAKPYYRLNDTSVMRIIKHGFTEQYKVNMFQKKGNKELQDLLISEIEENLEQIIKWFDGWVWEEHKAKSYYEIFHPAPTGTPTEIEAIQCYICATNKKDRALPCGHSYCCCCLEVLPNGKCPECNTVFDKTKVIKLYL